MLFDPPPMYENAPYMFNHSLFIYPISIEENEDNWYVEMLVSLPNENVTFENVKVWFSKTDKKVENISVSKNYIYSYNKPDSMVEKEEVIKALLDLNVNQVFEIFDKREKNKERWSHKKSDKFRIEEFLDFNDTQEEVENESILEDEKLRQNIKPEANPRALL